MTPRNSEIPKLPREPNRIEKNSIIHLNSLFNGNKLFPDTYKTKIDKKQMIADGNQKLGNILERSFDIGGTNLAKIPMDKYTR